MIKVTCYDSSGNPLDYLTQWDIGQTIVVKGATTIVEPVFHFCNRRSTEALVVPSKISDDSIIAPIPNLLLQEDLPIIAHMYYQKSTDSAKTLHTITIPVVPRARPSDYNYVENIDYVNWVALEKEARALIDKLEQSNFRFVPLTPSQIACAYLVGNKLVEITGNTGYWIDCYAVQQGVTYRLRGTGVRINIKETLAMFSVDLTMGTAGVADTDALIIAPSLGHSTNVATDYDLTFTPTMDGYIVVARVSSWPGLSIEKKVPARKPLKIQIFGDSLTENGGAAVWPDFLAEYLPDYDLTVVNSGKGGNALAKVTVVPPYEWPAGTPVGETGANKGVAYQIAARASGETVLDGLDTTADLYIIGGGTNDYAGGVKLGSFRDGDITTIYGAAQKIIEHIQSNTNGRILFLTPPQRYNATDQAWETAGQVDSRGNIRNKAGFTLEVAANAILETCGYYGVPCLDLYHESGISRNNAAKFTADGLHPNAIGAKRIAQLVAGKQRW